MTRHQPILFALLLTLLPLAACGPIPYSPREDMVDELGEDGAAERIEKILKRAKTPRVGDVTVDERFVLWQHGHATQQWTQIKYEQLARVDIYGNYRVFLYDFTGREMAWIEFSNPNDSREFADLLMSLRRKYR